MPVDVVPRTVSSGSRLSSFGFSGTIAHGAFEARKTIVSMSNDSKSLYRNKSLLTLSEHQYSPTRRIALVLDQTKVNVGEEARTVCCREQIVTLADHWRAPNRSYFGNQTRIVDEIEFQHVSCSPQFNGINICVGEKMTQINQIEMMQT